MAPVALPIANALTAMLKALPVTPGLWVPTTSTGACAWAPSMLSQVPAAVIDLPRIERTQLDTGERELGSDDWRLTFPVLLHVDLNVAERDQQRAIDLVEAFIAAIDANPSLGDPLIDDAKLVVGQPIQDLSETSRPLLTFECEVQVWKRVPS